MNETTILRMSESDADWITLALDYYRRNAMGEYPEEERANCAREIAAIATRVRKGQP